MNKIIYTLLAALFCLTSCFEDEGNYDYNVTNPPHWLNPSSLPTFYAFDARTVTLKGDNLFVWDTDSLQRSEEVTYEWEINNEIVGEGVELTMDTRELMEKANIKTFSSVQGTGTYGTFSVVEKSTGVKYMRKIQVFFYPRYSSNDWIILVDQNGKTKLNVLIQESSAENGFRLVEDAYEETNDGQSLPGTPISMAWAYDKHIGTQGSITVITDQGAYELNAEDLILYDRLDDASQFLDGLPSNLKPVKRIDIDPTEEGIFPPTTLLLSEDGKVYTRSMTPNYLGGKFLSEPYEIDEKGYDIKLFGNSLYGGLTPAFDAKNRRFVISSVTQHVEGSNENQEFFYQTRMAPLEGTTSYGAQVADIPESHEILYLGTAGHLTVIGNKQCFTCVYNTPESTVSQAADFAVARTSLIVDPSLAYMNNFSLKVKLDEKSQVITSGNSRTGITSQTMAKTMLYTKGNNVYYAQRHPWANFYPNATGKAIIHGTVAVPEVTSDIIYMSVAYYSCNQLFIACENGDIFVYDITVLDRPTFLYQGHIDGKVLESRQLGMHTANSDKFNH